MTGNFAIIQKSIEAETAAEPRILEGGNCQIPLQSISTDLTVWGVDAGSFIFELPCGLF